MSNRSKKILYFITKGNFGGAQRYVFDLATNLPANLFDVVVVLGEGDLLQTKLEEKGVRVIRIKNLQRNINPLKDVLVFFEFIRIVNEERPDVVHLNSSKAGALGALAVKIVNIRSSINYAPYGVSSIFTGHGWAFNENRSAVAKLLIAGIHSVTVLLSDITIAVSKTTAKQVARFPFVNEKIRIIYNGISEVSLLSKEIARKELGNFPHTLWIGSISELHTNKGLDYLIRAFEGEADAIPDAGLIIIGGGEEQKNLEKLIKSLKLEDRIHIVGFKSDARKYLKAFDIFTLTSRTEAFPYVPLEAGLASLPVIASRVGGIPEVIEHERNGILVDVGNIQHIRTAIRELVDHEERRAKYGNALYADVKGRFSLETEVEATMALY